MKRTSIFYFSLAAIATGSFISCQDYNPFDESTLQHLNAQKAFEATLNEYTKNFEDRFGKIDPNHDWGFGVVDPSLTRGEIMEKNMWINTYHLQVPGWPDKYYVQNNPNIVTGQYHYRDDTYTDVIEESIEPGGDVTDEEIQYVSAWFRTHRYPTSIPLHCSDFYIQDISSDNDRDANGHIDNTLNIFEYSEDNQEWTKKVEYKDAAFDYLAVKTTDNSNLDGYIHLEKFNGQRQNKLHAIETLSMDMDHPYETTWKIINGGDTNAAAYTNNRTMNYYTCAMTEDFRIHCSVDNQERSNYRFDNALEATHSWVLVHLHFIGQSGRIYDGYYLGFDYSAFKHEGNTYYIHEPDGYYSNWIVKITPGIPEPTHYEYSRRIMCEDLGNTYDLDFDDVVFDATLNWPNGTAYTPGTPVDVTITLRAAGGTMPIWVGVNPGNNISASNEIHQLLGNHPYTTPINVANPESAPVTAAVANYHTTIYSLDFDDIDIWVYNTKEKEFIKIPKAKCLNDNEHDSDYTEGDGNLWYVYNKNKDLRYAPQKFAVPTSVLWLKETRQIETGYPKFGEWAHDHTKFSIVDNGSSFNPWYLAEVNNSVLYGEVGVNPSIHLDTPGVPNVDNGNPGTTSSYQSIMTWDVTTFTNNAKWGTAAVINGVQSGGDSKRFDHGTTAILKATSIGDAIFLGWKDINSNNYLSTSLEFEITVNRHENIIAMFQGTKEKIMYSVTVSSEDTNMGTVEDISGSYEKGSGIVLKASANDGYELDGWYIDGSSYNNSNPAYYYPSYNNCNIVAKFRAIPMFELNVSSGENGTISISGDVTSNGTYRRGTNVTLTATPNDGYRFKGWYNDDSMVDGSSEKTFQLNSNCTLRAVFEWVDPVTE